eukprot:gene40512-9813_t
MQRKKMTARQKRNLEEDMFTSAAPGDYTTAGRPEEGARFRVMMSEMSDILDSLSDEQIREMKAWGCDSVMNHNCLLCDLRVQ